MIREEVEQKLREFFAGKYTNETLEDMVAMSMEYIYEKAGEEQKRFGEIINSHTPADLSKIFQNK